MDPALREEILSVLKGASDMTIATIRPDGYPLRDPSRRTQQRRKADSNRWSPLENGQALRR